MRALSFSPCALVGSQVGEPCGLMTPPSSSGIVSRGLCVSSRGSSTWLKRKVPKGLKASHEGIRLMLALDGLHERSTACMPSSSSPSAPAPFVLASRLEVELARRVTCHAPTLPLKILTRPMKTRVMVHVTYSGPHR